jgi:hypothetical protein
MQSLYKMHSKVKNDADKSQADLERNKATPLPTGRSVQMLKRNDETKEAYNATVKYSYAGTRDTKCWVWSPAEDAEDHIRDLK